MNKLLLKKTEKDKNCCNYNKVDISKNCSKFRKLLKALKNLNTVTNYQILNCTQYFIFSLLQF